MSNKKKSNLKCTQVVNLDTEVGDIRRIIKTGWIKNSHLQKSKKS
jgi:hypothetical protein